MAVDGWAADQRRLSNLESFRHFTEIWPEPKQATVRKLQPSAETLQELEWLLGNGAMPWEAAKALGRTMGTLSRLAYRNGRNDLGKRMLPERTWQQQTKETA